MKKLQLVTMKVADIKEGPYDPREISEYEKAVLKASLRRFGHVEPLIWDVRSKLLVSGHQRLKTLREMAVLEVQVVAIDQLEGAEKAENSPKSWDFEVQKGQFSGLETVNLADFGSFSTSKMPEISSEKPVNMVDKTCLSRVWITPESVLSPIRAYFGARGIELDPATEPENPTKAKEFYSELENGLSYRWIGNVYLNPPYGRDISLWAEKIYREAATGAHIVTLLPPTRTETGYWQEYIFNKYLKATCYIRKRVPFLRPSGEPAGNNPYGSVLYLYNGNPDRFLKCLSCLGTCIKIGKITKYARTN